MKPINTLKKSVLLFFVLPAMATAVALVCFGQTAQAVQTVPYKMNFQGRLTDITGTPKADGTYNIRFRIYNAANTAVWTEDHLVSASAGVALVNGLFTVQLGSVTPLDPALFNTATANQNGMTLEVELPTPATATNTSPSWTEGAMTPRSPIATSAYAFNSDTLDGLDSSVLARKDTTNTFSTSNTFNGTSLFSVNDSSAVGIQNTSGTKAFTADTSNMVVQVGSSTADASSVVFVLDTKNTAGDPTGVQQVAGSMYYNSNSGKFRCYQGAAWTDCITTPSGGTTLQDTYNASSSPATITTTAGKGVNIMAGAVPTADLFVVDNTANPTVTPGVNAINVKYAGGAVGGEGSGLRVDYTPGSTSGGTWSGLRIVANATGAVSGVESYGIKIEGPSSPGTGSEVGLRVASGFDIGVDVASGGLQLSGMNDPASPAVGDLRVYAKSNAGRTMLKMKGGNGIDVALQPFLGANRVALYQPTFGSTSITTSTTLGTTIGLNHFTSGTTASTTATVNESAAGAGSLFLSMKRTEIGTSTNPNTVGDLRLATLQFMRGSTIGSINTGGFYAVGRFGVSTYQAGARTFAGMAGTASALGNAEITTFTNILGFGCNTADTSFSFIHNDSSGTATKIALGANYPCNTSDADMYEYRIFVAPAGTTVYYSLARLNTTDFIEGSVTTDMPAVGQFLTPHFYIGNNTTAARAELDIASMYVETDN